MQNVYSILADAVLIAHVLIVLFNVVSLPVIWLGAFLQWSFVRNFYFRAIHLVLLAFIAVQSVAGEICPLTTWESEWRIRSGGAQYEGGFIAHWFHRMIFFECDEWIFTAAYVSFFGLVLLTMFLVKPRPPAWWRK